MAESIKNWWNAHSAGERWLMGVLGVAIFIVLLWLGIWRPMTDGLSSGWQREAAAQDRYGSVRAKVEALKHMPKPASVSSTPVDQLVNQTAAEAGFTLDRVTTPGAGRISVSIASARTGALLSWLSQLEAAGVGVQSISIVPGSTEGTVSMQAVFQGSVQ
jgi:general secretion pathway protein M